MNSFYSINGKEYSWKEFIEFADLVDRHFHNLDIKTTSKAIEALKEKGYKVKVYKED